MSKDKDTESLNDIINNFNLRTETTLESYMALICRNSLYIKQNKQNPSKIPKSKSTQPYYYL